MGTDNRWPMLFLSLYEEIRHGDLEHQRRLYDKIADFIKDHQAFPIGYFDSLHWYKKGVLDAIGDVKLLEGGLEEGFYEEYRDQFPLEKEKYNYPSRYKDIDIVKSVLPSVYKVKETKGGVHCLSSVGVSENSWKQILNDLKEVFGWRLQEIDHQVCSEHQSFTVFLKTNI